jgi:isocitrate dehydrogenase
MGAWSSDSKTHVSHMSDGDFYGSEQSAVVADEGYLKITFTADDGSESVLRESVAVTKDELVDAARMDCMALQDFFETEIAAAKEQGVLLSLHLKATMMKVSDPIMFGHAVKVYYKDIFEKHAAILEQIGVDANNGIGDLHAKIVELDDEQRSVIEADLAAVYAKQPALAMVNSDKGHHQSACPQ